MTSKELSLQDAADILSAAAILGGKSITVNAPTFTVCYETSILFPARDKENQKTISLSLGLFPNETEAYEALRLYLIQEFVPYEDMLGDSAPWNIHLNIQMWTEITTSSGETTLLKPEYIKHKTEFLKDFDIKTFAIEHMKGFATVSKKQILPGNKYSVTILR